MLVPSTDRAPRDRAIDFPPLRDSDAPPGPSERRPTWWLDESEQERLLGIKPRAVKAKAPAAVPKTSSKPQADAQPATPGAQPDPALGDFATLTPTLAALDRILRPPASDAPGLAPRHRGDRIRRLGVAFGVAAVMAAVVFFR